MRRLILSLVAASLLLASSVWHSERRTPGYTVVAQSEEVQDGGFSSSPTDGGIVSGLVLRIRFEGPIDHSSVAPTLQVLQMSRFVNMVVIEIDSGGGSVAEGFLLSKAIEDIRHSGKPVVCIVDGNAQSEAFYVLQSCSVRLMTPRSLLMAHEPLFEMEGPLRLTRLELHRLSVEQDTMAFAWTAHAGARLSLPLAEFRKRIRWDEWYMTAPAALKAGAIDGIVDSVEEAEQQLEP